MPDPNLPLVSFAIPCYNHERFIGETLESCLAQTYPHIEVVVVDDASTDGSRRVIEDFARRYPDRLRADFNDKNLGQALTARKAVRLTRGELIAGIGSDDVSLPHRIAAGVDLLRANPALGAVFSRVEVIDDDGRIIDSPVADIFNARYDNLRWRLLAGNCLCGPSVLARGELIRRHRPNSALRYVEDFDQWLRLLDDHEIHRDDDIWVKYRQHGSNLSIFTVDTAPLAPHYETAVCIIRALQRWPLDKLFHFQAPAGTPEREREEAQGHARLAEHCLKMDEISFGRPYLYSQEAYRQLVLACELDPANDLANTLLPEAWRRLGDTGRAAGGKPTTYVAWKEAAPATLAAAEPAADPFREAFRAWQEKTALRDIDGEHLARRMHGQWFLHPRFTVFLDGSDGAAAGRALASLERQLYGQWQAVMLGGTTGAGPRVAPVPAGTPPAAVLPALGRDTPEDWALLLPPGTTLEPQALYALADHINLKPQWQALYADDASAAGTPRFKPDFDPVLLAGGDYIGALAVAAPVVVPLAAGLPLSAGLGTALAWQIADTLGEASIGHVADVLSRTPDAAAPLLELTRACAEAHFARAGLAVHQADGPVAGSNWAVPALPALPPVTVVGLGGAIDALLAGTDYPALQAAAGLPPTPAALAEALAAAPSDLVLVCVPGLRPANPEWLQILVAAQQGWKAPLAAPAIADGEGRLEGAGLALGIGGSLGPVLPGTPYGQSGDALQRAALPRRVAAVESSCLLLSRAAVAAAGGLDTGYASLPGCLADLCLRLSSRGDSPLWLPCALLDRTAPPPAGLPEDPAPFVQRWLPALAADPWWNRHLTLRDGSGRAETDLAARWQPGRRDALRILSLPLPPSGQAEYRMTAPLAMLDRLGLAQVATACEPLPGRERAPTPVELARLDPDVLYGQAVVDDVRLEGYVAAARLLPRVFRIFSLDDRISDVPEYNEASRKLPRAAVTERMRIALAHSDRLVVSTAPLADLYAKDIGDIRIVPNRLEKALWGKLPPRPPRPAGGRKPRVGWAGAVQHAGDLAIVAPVIEALAGEVDWVFFGMIPAGCERFVAEFHPPVRPYAAYPPKLAALDLDLALAPLEINLFNEAKSNLRLLEYGILGWPVIASDIEPYRTDNAPVMRVANTAAAWREAIRAHLADPAAARRQGEALKAWVEAGYLLEDHSQEWLGVLTP